MDSVFTFDGKTDVALPDCELAYLSFSKLNLEQLNSVFDLSVWLELQTRAKTSDGVASVYTVRVGEGDTEQTVEFIDEGVRYYGRCGCDRFAEMDVCEHVWALQVWNRGTALKPVNHDEATAAESETDVIESGSEDETVEQAAMPAE